MSEQHVITEVRDTTGIITLNRPKALNSLTHEMVTAIQGALDQWRDDSAIEQVVIVSSGKHFCSGGDVRQVRDGVLAGDLDRVDTFFREEYALNVDIANYPKPYIALCNGVIMGGGMGVSAHAKYMVVTEDAFASMPEMFIGYITDVGMSWLLQKLPEVPSQSLGTYLGLTGYRMTADDMLATGLASHKVATLDGVLDGIVAEGPGYLDTVALPQGDSELVSRIDDIAPVFTGSWPEIQAKLADAPEEFRAQVEELTVGASPSSLVAAAELFEANKDLDLERAIANELVLGGVVYREPDFAEGVRAVLVDKTKDADFAPQPDPEKYRKVLSS
ncbi:3-hydroxyisobutyryl-CoA hydrolase [Corynebacterium jeddahense]|uniref:3-hydroxyisobutyryl-CoA hydrolase n=1 Tax=Corynebacterium jeddahense TaxID=1414719 RepID=A0ABY7UIE7_9CORY|nr:3-hydroxyisobutyryl-CoA hydrolase [Corynebacterium jeddahense]WCZ38391.1 putative enoyl-CoA hydratase echA8 [Corynebacterium jeddahense]